MAKRITFIILTLCAFFAKGQVARISAVLDTSVIRIGEQANIDLYLETKPGDGNIHVQWPELGDTITEKVDVVNISAIDTTFPEKNEPGRMLQHQRITISVYDSGFYAIPGFKYVVNGDTAHPQFSNPLFIKVHTVPTDSSEKKLKDIKQPFDQPFNWRWFEKEIWGGLAFIVVLVVSIILYRRYLKRKQQVIFEPKKPAIPPHITALAALEKLRDEKIWKDGKVKEYYSGISDSLRLYIEGRFGFSALESTTDEIMTAFRGKVIDPPTLEKLRQILMLSDLVKFAKMTPVEAEHEFTIENAFDFVNGTKREDPIDIETPTETNNP